MADDRIDPTDSDEPDDPWRDGITQICWSCWREFKPGQGEGISIDETGEEQVCDSCWQMIPVTSRLVLGLLFRRLHHGGLGLHELIEDALRTWPFSARPDGGGRGFDRPSRQ